MAHRGMIWPVEGAARYMCSPDVAGWPLWLAKSYKWDGEIGTWQPAGTGFPEGPGVTLDVVLYRSTLGSGRLRWSTPIGTYMGKNYELGFEIILQPDKTSQTQLCNVWADGVSVYTGGTEVDVVNPPGYRHFGQGAFNIGTPVSGRAFWLGTTTYDANGY